MSFHSSYETLYKECLSLKQKQVEWKAFKKSLINEVKTLKGEKKSLLNKIVFLKSEHFDMMKTYDELINSGRKSFDKQGLGFVAKTITPSSGTTIFEKLSDEETSKENHSKLKFHCSHCDKWDTLFIDSMQECLITFKETWLT